MLRSITTSSVTAVVNAWVDTGADGTLAPAALLADIQADEVYNARLRSHWGEWRAVKIYLVDLWIDQITMPSIEVIADEYTDRILLGRNVLNKLILLLDGPIQEADILSRRP